MEYLHDGALFRIEFIWGVGPDVSCTSNPQASSLAWRIDLYSLEKWIARCVEFEGRFSPYVIGLATRTVRIR
jgi:hypothetical protein